MSIANSPGDSEVTEISKRVLGSYIVHRAVQEAGDRVVVATKYKQ